ncbi:DUF349 domain-containing protein [Rheinheimera sp. D18]|uniref:DUF349 domain-containing protein n=1 Tax=Rheinheimera sp. D18 TaxID=2545632 RepID=UPI00105264AA|nr:DUF349 domain-containing protein [Rheinheimera sp. D18]QBL09434.1 DUF349 domain-containing protein [Rheinheimera sp. D18]
MIFKRFFKPKWQHADALVRQQAIQTLNPISQEHKSILHELAFNDGSEAVRKAALLKLNDFSLWWQSSKHDSSERLQQLAEQTLIEQLLQNKVEAKLKQKFIAQCNRGSILEQLAQTETDAEIKFNLLLRLNKTELNHKALLDPVLQLSQKRELLANINDEKLLEKLVKQLDGELQHDIKQKLHMLSEQKQKPIQLRKQLTLLLAKLNATRERVSLADIPAHLADYDVQWQQLSPELDCLADEATEYQQKYDKIVGQIQQWLTPRLAELEQIQVEQAKTQAKLVAQQTMQQQLSALEYRLQQTLLNTDINAAQQLEQQLHAFTTELANADITDKLSLGKRAAQLQQQLAQLPLLAEQLAQLTRIVADWAAIAVPDDIALFQQSAEQVAQFKNDWRQLSKAMIIAVPLSLQQAKTELTEQWKTAAKAFNAEGDKTQRQCRSKLAQYRRLYNAGKYKVLFGLFKGIEEDYQQLTPALQAQLSKDYEFARDKMAELADWQEYIATPRKQQLLEQIQQLDIDIADSAVRKRADEVKLARAQWISLGKADPVQEEQLNTAFDQACERAFSPCRVYFAAQDAQRAEHVKQREQLIQQAIALQTQQHDTKTLDRHLQQLKQAWQQAGSVDKQQFSGLNDAFNAALTPLREQLNATQQQVAIAKQQLIDQARAALALEEANLTAKILKECQQQWKTLGQAARKQDQALWTEFRAVCDGFFNARAEQVELKKVAEQAELQQFSASLNQLTAMLEQAEEPSAFTAVQQQLDALQPQSAATQQAVKQLQEILKQRQRQWQQQQGQREFSQMFELLTNPAVSSEQLPAMYRDVFATQQERQFSREQLTLALEIIANVPSPVHEQGARQQVQLLLLSDKHNQGNVLDKDSLLKRWLQFGAVAEHELPLLARVKALFI